MIRTRQQGKWRAGNVTNILWEVSIGGGNLSDRIVSECRRCKKSLSLVGFLLFSPLYSGYVAELCALWPEFNESVSPAGVTHPWEHQDLTVYRQAIFCCSFDRQCTVDRATSTCKVITDCCLGLMCMFSSVNTDILGIAIWSGCVLRSIPVFFF